MNKSIITLFIVSVMSWLAFSGCDVIQSSSDGPSEVQIQMQVKTPATTANKHKSANLTNEIDDLVIEEVKLFVEEMELESIQDDSLDFEIENFIVNLPLDGSPLVITEEVIPAGIYDEFELEIEKPDDDDVYVDDPDFRDETGSYSVVVKGLYNGEDFTFRSSEDFEIDIDLFPPLEISESENAVLVVSIDVDSWFRGSSGEYLDPKDFSNTEQINKNIERSFEAEEERYDDKDFEGYVESVNSDEDVFTLDSGLILQISSYTDFDGDFKSLAAVKSALESGMRIEAEGEFFTQSDGTNIVLEVDFEIEDDDEREIEGFVQSVDQDESSFTLENGMSFLVTDATEFDGDLKSLEEVADALDNANRVEAEVEYYTNPESINIAKEVEFDLY